MLRESLRLSLTAVVSITIFLISTARIVRCVYATNLSDEIGVHLVSDCPIYRLLRKSYAGKPEKM